MSREGWIGVDLDGTLARYESRQGIHFVGGPIAPMVERVKDWLAQGKRVKIFTARVYCSESGDPTEREQQRTMIREWCKKHLGQELEITCVKDYDMIELWDDRAVAVEKNVGRYKRWR
jgi:hypothetical protein